jgi:uracil-DNA glycosylase family 4
MILPSSLRKLTKEIRRCQRCERSKTRILAVPGEGSPRADILLLGEAPGKQENKTGQPFVGRAGIYLDKILADHKLKRERLFITSILKCYHPNSPKKSQIKICKIWTLLQIEAVNPKVILVMGRHAAWGLFKIDLLSKDPIQGEWKGIPSIVTCHPASAMRFPQRHEQFIKATSILLDLLGKNTDI